MVIEEADRYGLSQLHQLRGRVGRGEHESHCILFADTEAEAATIRLEAISSERDGFKLAEVDLSLRGEGEILGTRQHGLPRFRVATLPEDAGMLIERPRGGPGATAPPRLARRPRARPADGRGSICASATSVPSRSRPSRVSQDCALRHPEREAVVPLPLPTSLVSEPGQSTLTSMRVVAGELGGRRLDAPRGARVRPTADRVREALFSILGDVGGARVLDLYCGTGALAIEARLAGRRERGARRHRTRRGAAERRGARDRRSVRGRAIRRPSLPGQRGRAGSISSSVIRRIDSPTGSGPSSHVSSPIDLLREAA